MNQLFKLASWAIMLTVLSMVSCRKNPVISNVGDTLNSTWSELSHGANIPQYDIVFPQEKVNRLEIVIGSENWSAIRSNMTSLYGNDFGVNPGGPPGTFPTVEPDYVPTLVKFNNRKWEHTGFRLKGNSTLTDAWRRGIYKLPFRLNFDKFEGQFPSIQNQHFYGFKDLSFSPGAKDNSLMHEKLASDALLLAGIPCAKTAFYAVYIDFGQGLKYAGLYTAVELPDDHMIETQLGEATGNIYKPESQLLSFNQAQFEKKNNELLGDFGDVKSLVSALNSPNRTSDTVAWRANLESIFDVNHFTHWLAVNNAIVNWDVYGIMAHNFYLYNHSQRKLTWIPWDHNEAFSSSPGISATSVSPQTGFSLKMTEINANWPLISHIIHDNFYLQKYKGHLKDFNDQVLSSGVLESKIDTYYNLISPYVVGVNGEQPKYTYLSSSSAFTASPNALKTHLANRKSLITQYLQ